jgi:hypothetical protein
MSTVNENERVRRIMDRDAPRFDRRMNPFDRTIPDPGRAVGEAHRVLRPGGTFRALEPVRSPVPLVRRIQRVLDPLSVRFAADHLVREPLD